MKIPVLLLMCILFTSCLKRNETEVNKKCVDSCMTFNIRVGTGEKSAVPVKKAIIELSWSRPATPLGDPGRLIARGKTNEYGLISFSFKAQPKELKAGKYSVVVKNNMDGFQPYNSHYGITKFDTVVKTNVHLPSKATLKLIFKNFKSTTNSDFFQASPFFKNYGSNNLMIKLINEAGSFSNPYFFGTDPSFSKIELTGTTAGNQFTYFNIIRKKNGIREDLKDSIYIPEGEMKTYEIEY